MGLDMFAYKKRANQEKEEFFRWRKFNALHGFFEDLYRERGGTEEFNCIPLRIYPEDLEALDKATLRPRVGLFFGLPSISEKHKESVSEFILLARMALAEGYEVYYDSWW